MATLVEKMVALGLDHGLVAWPEGRAIVPVQTHGQLGPVRVDGVLQLSQIAVIGPTDLPLYDAADPELAV